MNISDEAFDTLQAIQARGGTVYLTADRQLYDEIHHTAIRELVSGGYLTVVELGPGRCVEITERGEALLQRQQS